MKQMLLAILSAFSFGVSAQITVTSSTFPQAGDTLSYATDLQPNLSNVATPPGGNQIWDFSQMEADQAFDIVYQPASSGQNASDFPGSDLVVIGQTGETYYNLTNNELTALGYAGGDPANFGIQVLAKFGPPVIERYSPMNFFDINPAETNLTLPFSFEDLPDTLIQGLPFQPDSIRIRINFQRLDVVDGWGTVKIPGAQYDALRQKRTEYTQTRLDVKIPFLGWQDVTDLLQGGGGGGIGSFLGVDTTVSYRFYSSTEKEEIATVTLDNTQTEAVSARFKNTGIATPVIHINAPGNASISAFPNPAIEWVRFDCINLPADEYTLKIFNILGKIVWKEQYQLSGNKSIRLELDNFRKGTYLYSLVNKSGTVIGTKRLVVVKP